MNAVFIKQGNIGDNVTVIVAIAKKHSAVRKMLYVIVGVFDAEGDRSPVSLNVYVQNSGLYLAFRYLCYYWYHIYFRKAILYGFSGILGKPCEVANDRRLFF